MAIKKEIEAVLNRRLSISPEGLLFIDIQDPEGAAELALCVPHLLHEIRELENIIKEISHDTI